MKKYALILIPILLSGMLCLSCGDAEADQASKEAQKEAVLLDSISQNLDQTADSLKNEAESVSNTVDQLLENSGTKQ